MAGVALGGQRAELEHQLVAVRADQGDPAVDLLLADRLQRPQELLLGLLTAGRQLALEGAAVLQRRLPATGGQLPVRGRHQRLQGGHQLDPEGRQLGPGTSQMAVPDLQRGQVGALAATGPAGHRGGLQQGVALLEHPLVVLPHAGQPGRAGGQQLVQEAPPLAGVALDQAEVLRGEQHGAQQAQHIARADVVGAVDPGPVGLARGELQLDQGGAAAVHHRGADPRPLGAQPDQRGVGGDPVAAQGGDVADRLDQVGLALAVGPDEGRHARVEGNLGPGVRPEVGERQMRNMHGCGLCPPSVDEPGPRPGWGSAPVGTTSTRPRGRRTGCAARRSSSSAASRPGGRRTGRTARR